MNTLQDGGTDFVIAMNENIVYADTAGVVYTGGLSIKNKGLQANIGSKAEESEIASFVVSTATDNPKAGNVIVSKTNTTNVNLLKFTVKNDSDVSATINKASTTITVNAAATGAAADIRSLVTAVELFDGSTRLQSVAPVFEDDATTTEVKWDNFTLPIAANTTKTLTIKAVLASVQEESLIGKGGEFILAKDFTMQGVDANSNVVGDDYTLEGKTQHIFLKAPVFALGTVSFTATGSSDNPQSIGNAKIGLSITAQGGSDIYVSSDPTKTYLAVVRGSSTTSSSTAFTCTSGAFDETDKYRIPAGTTASCELNGVIDLEDSSQTGYYQLQVGKITWGTSTTPNVEQTWGWDDFKTGLLYLKTNVTSTP